MTRTGCGAKARKSQRCPCGSKVQVKSAGLCQRCHNRIRQRKRYAEDFKSPIDGERNNLMGRKRNRDWKPDIRGKLNRYERMEG